MRILRFFLTSFALVYCFNTIAAQDKNVTIHRPASIDSLMEYKKTNTQASKSADRYRIQVFYGNNNEARTALRQAKTYYPNLEATIVFTSPEYKVYIGNFKTRLEAERNIRSVKQNFPNALLIQPDK